MKKVWMLTLCGLLTACVYDSARLNQNKTYPPQQPQSVAVYFRAPVPNHCRQIGLTSSYIITDTPTMIQQLQNEAAAMGANYVDIADLTPSRGWAHGLGKSINAIFYLCQK